MANFFDKELQQKAKQYVYTTDNSTDLIDSNFVRQFRGKYDMTQLVFSSVIGVSKKAVEKWEQHTNKISEPTKKLLYLLDKHPQLINDLYHVEILNAPTSADEPLVENSPYTYQLTLNQDFSKCLKDKSPGLCIGSI
ncbi:MAG: type II toxin-antitoxin system MqsA family antitoxin [Acholeplasmataceae bacterium]|nr:type II toxin-antitoxin system MqsA family antitoxin [Acholeplasmataceae bacterium]